MSREEDHKTLQEECKDAKVAFLRRRKIDRERRVHEVEGRPQAGFCRTVPGVQGGTGKAVESSPRQQRFKASRGNNQAKGKAPWNLTETDSSKTCQWNWTGKRAPFEGYAISGRKETCYRKQPGKRTSVESPKSRRAAVNVTARTGRKQSRLAEETKHERRPTVADGTSERLYLKDTAANICTTADGQILKIAVCITKSGPRMIWQPSIASRKTCATIIVSFAKKHGRRLLPDSRYFLAPDASETESRVDYILLRTTWILEASQQNYKASVKSRNCWLHERSRL